jgi:GPH family glycoside/pentoside/hexuronide:cation symporter
VVDAGEIALGTRQDGQMSGFTNFINQIAQGVGIAFVMAVIGFAGFQEQVPGAPTIVSQPDSAMLAIRLIMAFIPLVFMGIGSFISFQYKIDKSKQKELQDCLLSGDAVLKAELTDSLNK